MDKRCFRGNKKARKQRVYELLGWCGKRDLNPYVKDTRPSNVPVCQFQHCRILVSFKLSFIIISLSIAFVKPFLKKTLFFLFFSHKQAADSCLRLVGLLIVFFQVCKFLRHGRIVLCQLLDRKIFGLVVRKPEIVLRGEQCLLRFFKMVYRLVDLIDRL